MSWFLTATMVYEEVCLVFLERLQSKQLENKLLSLKMAVHMNVCQSCMTGLYF